MAIQDKDFKEAHRHLKCPHFEIYAYALNIINVREGNWPGCALYTTEDAYKDQKDCGFTEILQPRFVEDVPLSLVHQALDEIIKTHYGKAYTHEQFYKALIDLLKLADYPPNKMTLWEALQNETKEETDSA